MQRLLLFSVLTGVVALLAISLAGLSLTYGLDTPPNRIRVDDLGGLATIMLPETDAPPLLTASGADFYPALGALHGTRALWQAILLRQVALGQMMAWVGPSGEAIDRAVFSLDLEHRSRMAFEALPERDKAHLVAFTRGFNAALRETALSDRFLSLLSVTPEPWEPWHTLLIERLWLWLVADIDASGVEPLPAVREAYRSLIADRALVSKTLALHGFDNQVQWASTVGDTTITYVRYVLGSSALSWLTEVQLTDERYLLQLPGTPFTLASFSRDEARAYLPTAAAQLRWVSTDSQTRVRKRTFTLSDGSQETIPLTFYDNALRLTRTVLTTETGLQERDLVLSWSGFTSLSDAPTWMSVSPDFTALRLFEPLGAGGEPTSSRSERLLHPTGWVQGGSRVANALRVSLEDLHTQGIDVREAIERPFSAALYERAMRYADALSLNPRTVPAEQIAYTYLRGWDGQFEPSSIGATIFTYLENHLEHTWTAGDSLPQQAYARAFSAAVADLTADLGPLPLEWRWEKAFTPTLHFPVWGDGQSIRLTERIWRLYPPLSVLPIGSPYALRYGPSPKQDPVATASIEIMWVREGEQTQVFVRRTAVNVNTFMARYLYEFRERYPTPVWATNQGRVRIIRLVPTS